MHRRVAGGLIWLGCAIAFALPLAAAVLIAHNEAVESESERAGSVARGALQRAESAGQEALAAEERLLAAPSGEHCSDEGLARMVEIVAESTFLRVVGHIDEQGRINCSSLGSSQSGLPLGPVSFVSPNEVRFRIDLELGSAIDQRYVAMERGHFLVALLPASLIDVYVAPSDVSLGLFARSEDVVLSRAGSFVPEDAKWLHTTERSVAFDGKYLVAIERSADFDLAAYAAIPADSVDAKFRSLASTLAPFGALVGLGLAALLMYATRHQGTLPSIMRKALRERQFVVHYQPIVDLNTWRIVGVEALLRWPGKNGTSVKPDVFIPVAEESGVINGITQYVLDQVASDAPRMLAEWPEGYISINLSAHDLHSDDIVDSLRKLLDTKLLNPQNLMVEATEHSFVDPERARLVVGRIRELGIRVAIDDFGTGYSSLGYLTSLKTDCLKIDRTFVETVGTESVTSHVALHIIWMAETLGLTLIAEGVENHLQAEFLLDNGVQLAQGWLFAPALPMTELMARINEQLGRTGPQFS